MKTTDKHVLWFVTERGRPLPTVVCLCGAKKRHTRPAVQERWTLKHIEKTGAVWLNGSPEFAAEAIAEVRR